MAPLNSILFLDIETAPQYDSFESMPDAWKELWASKAESLTRYQADGTPESLYNRAGIYAEFGRIICISCGIIQGRGEEKRLVMKSFFCEEEKELLEQFCNMLCKWTAENNKYLCAHNGKEFDFPYLCRRMTILGMKLPTCLNIAGRRPWEVPFLDTMELWKFGDYKSYTSLNLLANVLGIPSPKDDMDGSMVGDIYWSAKTQEQKEKCLERIATYCQKDVVTVAQVYLRLQGEELVSQKNIEYKRYGSHQLFVRS
ncbi:MAG: 3'-5' exonuclease [Chitinophagaceae bacterium]